jgi:hypothetical protein
LPQSSASRKGYDLFISHANTDKLNYINDLQKVLAKLGINIFYDENSIGWGDNRKQKILNGVADSEFAIIVISGNFFGREWTERELQELLHRQNSIGQKIILPLLYDVSVEDMKSKYHELSEIQCLESNKHSKKEAGCRY